MDIDCPIRSKSPLLGKKIQERASASIPEKHEHTKRDVPLNSKSFEHGHKLLGISY